jgi:hypothetical protein
VLFYSEDILSYSKVFVKMKYILVSGGVISGLGKGVIASSVGALLKSCGLHVTSVKIDPYLNIDAGTFSPYEHGKKLINTSSLCLTIRCFFKEYKEYQICMAFHIKSI